MLTRLTAAIVSGTEFGSCRRLHPAGDPSFSGLSGEYKYTRP